MGALANDALLEGACDNGTPLATVDNVTCHKQLMKMHTLRFEIAPSVVFMMVGGR